MKRPIRDALVTAGILVVSFLFSLIANIRKKLGERPSDRKYISNELGVGYRMISDGE